ncbi:MAG: protein kinase [Pseudomonadales bacterium RIFCSPLOWO2_12_59_9]|nr:MAG: protein kinase [Pseudomonadales bacterium RIFCSPLOWO2_12_59_9]
MNDKLIEIAGYTIHGQLGKGGMAEVYLATQNSLQRKVAIKVLCSSVENEFSQRFINEGHIVASLHHAAIVTIYDIDKLADGRHYLAMEFIAGGDLTQYKGQVLTAQHALSITQQIAEGLQVVHQQGLVHRDIKPANILFRQDGSVVITDFGVAKDLAIDNELTQFGVAVGSPAYSSPEQAQCQPLDQRTDIYSLGVLLLEMLTGTNEFRGPSYTQTVMNHVQMPIPQLPAHLGAYQAVLERMLAKDVTQRFANCRELLQSLALLQDDDLSATRFSAALSLPPPAAKRSAGVKALALVFGLFLLAGLGYAGYLLKVNMQVADYLAKAEVRLSEDKLLMPPEDNADYFFGQVLLLEPENLAAQAGLQRVIAARAAASIKLAQLRIASLQLTSPAEDNALFYFQQALALTPDNQQALNGFQQIAELYIEQANAAYASREFAKALENIQLGLQVQPENPQLLKMASGHARYVKRATQRIAPRVAARTATSSVPAKSQTTKPIEDSSNPVSRLWDHILSNGMD